MFSYFSCSSSSHLFPFSGDPSLVSPSGPPVRVSPFVYLLIPVSASRGQSEDVCARQKKMMSSLFERRRAGLVLSHNTDTVVYTMPPLFKTGSLSYTELLGILVFCHERTCYKSMTVKSCVFCDNISNFTR